MTALGEHLFTIRAGRRLHSHACWCWHHDTPPADQVDEVVTVQGIAMPAATAERVYPYVVATVRPRLARRLAEWLGLR